MAALASKAPKLQPSDGGGGFATPPIDRLGGGDSGSEEERITAYQERLRRCRLGLVLGLVSITMLFIALSGVFLMRQHASLSDPAGSSANQWMRLALPSLLLINTFILLLSSATLELARRILRRQTLLAPLTGILGDRQEKLSSLPWLAITLVLGLGFLAGQAVAWRSMQHDGFYLAGNPSSAFFYLLTGAHAIHLMVGVIALLCASLAHVFARALETRCLIVDVTSWYWHFMAVLWIYVYAVLLFAN